MKRKGWIISLGVIVALAATYMLGPTMPKPVYEAELPPQPGTAQLAEFLVHVQEGAIQEIRPGNASQIIWVNDSLKEKTDYVLLYLHGFSASPMEGHPVHVNVGREIGANVYIPRLYGHGLDVADPLFNMTPDSLWESAKQALVTASALGDRVIVMATSTGGTLALKLAAEYVGAIHSLVLCSPNIRLYDKTAALLAKPWGLQIARMVMGGDFRVLEPDSLTDPYWYNRYRVESLVALQQLVQTTMKADLFKQVDQPVFTAYYYKDDENQDKTVSVEAIKWMHENLGSRDEIKVLKSYPEAGSHVICSDLTSQSWNELQDDIIDFLKTIMVH